MNRSYTLLEIHYALWAVLAVPIGFAGMFFLIPGLIFEIGIPLLVIAAILIVYVAKLTQGVRAAWLFGLAVHALLVIGAVYYIPRLPTILGLPLVIANLYSLIVLLVYRKLWTGAPEPAARRAIG